MKVLGEKSISSLVNIILKVIFAGGIGIIVLLPIILKWFLDYFTNDQRPYVPMLIALYISGIVALYIIFKFTGLFKTLENNTPFIEKNVSSLKRIAIGCLIIAVIYLVGIFIFKSVFVAVIFMIFTIAYFAFLILAELFKQAVEYKEENDLTI